MALPLCEVNKLNRAASKPGNLIDRYIKVQDINNAVKDLKEEIKKNLITGKFDIFELIDKWILVKQEKEKEYVLVGDNGEYLNFFTIEEKNKESFKKGLNWDEKSWIKYTKVKE